MGRQHSFAKEKVVFALAVASLTAPTRPEITAAVALVTPGLREDEGLRSMDGFEAATQFIDTPDGANEFIGKIPGRQTSGEPMLTFYESDTAWPKRTALAEGTSGFLIRMPYGDVAGRRCEVWPVTVASVNTSPITDGNDATTFSASFATTQKPERNAVIPA